MLRIEVAADEAEVVADALWQAGASAVGEEPRPADGVVVLTADLDACPPAIAKRPHSLTADDGAWRDGWRSFARAVRAGPFLVRPPWVDAAVPEGAVELVLDGGRAFGTGSHPSTVLALAALAGVVAEGMSVLDAGCGSGALAVGVALLGARRVLAVDVDESAVEATAANAARNGVAGRVDVVLGAVENVATPGGFDVVAANLGAPLVHDRAGALRSALAPGGFLVLSGMLGDQSDRVAAAYPGMRLVASSESDGWTCAVLGDPSR